MDDRLKELMQDLGNAINESLSDSDRIAEAIGEIRNVGYDVFLVLEATIGFSKQDQDFQKSDPPPIPSLTCEDKSVKINLTSQDEKFLKALKIDLKDL